ncbi:hypothetical protein TrLO_g13707 [Triparma laevis f. longispina]|uniref:Uncharacterized protein n=1 Tax=Triparma laevis f. longispina TaxID=1714387 RepID=A0A9W7AEW0_9STRA|nr:hypothetical protein TrLO_g13707 [Triparma laevis f. longispina]
MIKEQSVSCLVNKGRDKASAYPKVSSKMLLALGSGPVKIHARPSRVMASFQAKKKLRLQGNVFGVRSAMQIAGCPTLRLAVSSLPAN